MNVPKACESSLCMIKWLSHEILATIQNWESVKILLLYKLSETLMPIIDLLWGRETLVIMTATVFECHVNIPRQLFKSITSCLGRKDSSLLAPRVTQRLNGWCLAISGALKSARLRWQHRDVEHWGGDRRPRGCAPHRGCSGVGDIAVNVRCTWFIRQAVTSQADCLDVDLWSGLIQLGWPPCIYIRRYNSAMHVGCNASHPFLLPLPAGCSHTKPDSSSYTKPGSSLYTQGSHSELPMRPCQTLSTWFCILNEKLLTCRCWKCQGEVSAGLQDLSLLLERWNYHHTQVVTCNGICSSIN